jgi:uncharacterized membrane protein YgcG
MLAAVRAAIHALHLLAYAAICALHVLTYAAIYALHPMQLLFAQTRLPMCVSLYSYICVLVLLYMSSYYYICVLILSYMCPHTAIYVSSYELILLHMCPRSPANTTLAQQPGLDDQLPSEGGRKQDARGMGGGGSSGGGVVLDLLSVVCARGYSECAVALVEALSEGAGAHFTCFTSTKVQILTRAE